MNTIPVPLQNVLRQRYQTSLLLEKRDEGIERQYKKIEYLPEPPEQQYKGPPEGFGNQVTNRLKEIASDPWTYGALATGALLAMSPLAPIAIPAMAITGAGLGGWNAYQQASEGDYGAATVDAALGLLPFGAKNVRGSIPQLAKGKAFKDVALAFKDIAKPSPTSSTIPTSSTTGPAITINPRTGSVNIDPLTGLRMELISRRFDPIAKNTTMDQINQWVKDAERTGFKPWQWEASEAMSQAAEARAANPWKSVLDDMANPRGTPRRRRGQTWEVSPRFPTRRELNQMLNSENPEVRLRAQIILNSRTRAAIEGGRPRLGDPTETTIGRELIQDYISGFGEDIPTETAARSYLRGRGLNAQEPPTYSAGELPPGFNYSVIPVPNFRRPADYSSREDYLNSIEKTVKRELTPEERQSLSEVYDEDVRKLKFELERESRVPLGSPEDLAYFENQHGYYEIPEPATNPSMTPAQRTAAAVAAAAKLATSMPDVPPIEVAPTTPIAVAVDATTGSSVPTSRPSIPSSTPVKVDIPEIPSTPSRAPSTNTPAVPVNTPATTVDSRTSTANITPVVIPTPTERVKIDVPEILKGIKPADVTTGIDDSTEFLDDQSTPDQAYFNLTNFAPAAAVAAAMASTNFKDNAELRDIPEIPFGRGRGRGRFRILPSSGGRAPNRERENEDLVAMLAPSAEELRTALKRGQLGQVSGYYQLA